MGIVLPDLVKNAKKEWSLRPEKAPHLFSSDLKLKSILEGWKRHLEVDRHFHSSDFFCYHTQNIKALIGPFLMNTDTRPSFVAHISLELMLDNIILTENIISTERFYRNLSETDRDSLNTFLLLNKITNTAPFFLFLNEFISSEYLNSYRESSHIIYALGRICMRLWTNPFTDTQKMQLTAVLLPYLNNLKKDYMVIFNEIESALIPYT